MKTQKPLFLALLLFALCGSEVFAQRFIDSSLVFENPIVEGVSCYVADPDTSSVQLRGATFLSRNGRYVDSLELSRKMKKRKRRARKAGRVTKAKRFGTKAKGFASVHKDCQSHRCEIHDYYQGTEIGERLPACSSPTAPTPTPTLAPVPDSSPSPNPTVSPSSSPSATPEPSPTPFTDDPNIVGAFRFTLSGSIPTLYSHSLLLEGDGSFRLVISKVFTVYSGFNYIPCGTRVMLYRVFGSYTYLNNILSLSSVKRENYFSEVTGCFPNNSPLDEGEEVLLENSAVIAGVTSNGLTVVADEYSFEGSTYYRADYCSFMPFVSWCEEVESFDTLFLDRE